MNLKKDVDFEYWRQNHKKSSRAISALALIFSFRIFKLFYSHFYGLDSFKAPFANPGSFQKAMILFSVANIVFCYAPIVLIDIVGLLYLYWKTQLYITMIETATMVLITLILTIIEFCYLKRLISDDGGYK